MSISDWSSDVCSSDLFSFASKRYRDFSRRIAVEMATRYGHHPAVVGWQIDNEVGPPSFDPEAVAAWHAFLKTRYGTIDELNRRWTTEYWSQHYNDFDQVPLHADRKSTRLNSSH